MSRSQRLSKVIAHSGLASRRGAEALVEEGKVLVNSQVVYHPGHPVNPDVDVIMVEGRPLPAAPPRVYYAAYKPKGYITSREDPQGRKSVVELVEDLAIRVEPVGRLDYNTEGLLLFTNDGELANLLTHPSSQVPKRYHVKVWKEPDVRTLKRLRRGLVLEDGRTAPAKVRILESTESGNTWLEITVTEGRNRLVRRMMEKVGHPVSKLRRVSFGTISLGKLERGQVRPLTGDEIRRLEELGEGKRPEHTGQKRYKKGYARPKVKGPRPLGRKKAQARRNRARSAAGPKAGRRGPGSKKS